MHFAKLGNCTCYNQKIAFQNRARIMEYEKIKRVYD